MPQALCNLAAFKSLKYTVVVSRVRKSELKVTIPLVVSTLINGE